MENLKELTTEQLQEMKAQVEAILLGRAESSENLCHDIRLVVDSGTVKVASPYNSCFVTKARGLKGTWDKGQWLFNTSVAGHVKNAMLECYGVTGETPYEIVTLVVSGYDDYERQKGIELFGRPIAKAFGRDSGAKAQDGIFLIEGQFTSGGSVKNWQTVAKNATFEIHNYPKAALNRADVKEAIEKGWCRVK